MIRIIIGTLIALGILGSFASPTPVFTENAEYLGYVIGKIGVVVLSVWLIYSGIKNVRKEKHAEEKTELPFFKFLKAYFGGYREFLKKYLEKGKFPFFWLVICMVGAGKFLDMMEYRIFIGTPYPIYDWVSAWIMAVLFGFVIGGLSYWIIGSLYYLFAIFAEGHKNAKIARNLYLYAALPIAATEIALKIIEMMIYGKNYFEGNVNMTLDNVFTYIGFAVLAYYFILLYIGFRETLKTKKIRSLVFFIILPALLHISVITYSTYKSYTEYKNVNAIIDEINSQSENGAVTDNNLN